MKKDLRPAIIRAHEQGRGVREIAEFLSITPMMVSRAIKRFEETDEWPPSSPDLNPLDYAIWGYLEAKACEKPHSNVASLKRALEKAWDEISVEMLAKIVDNFPKRLKKCVDANGGYFE